MLKLRTEVTIDDKYNSPIQELNLIKPKPKQFLVVFIILKSITDKLTMGQQIMQETIIFKQLKLQLNLFIPKSNTLTRFSNSKYKLAFLIDIIWPYIILMGLS